VTRRRAIFQGVGDGRSKSEWPKANITKVLAPYSNRMKKLLADPEAFYTPKLRPSGHDIGKAFAKGAYSTVRPLTSKAICHSGISCHLPPVVQILTQAVHRCEYGDRGERGAVSQGSVRWHPVTMGLAANPLRKAIEASPQAFDQNVRSRPPWLRSDDYEHLLDGLRKAGWQG
jgi:hypothetical protein